MCICEGHHTLCSVCKLIPFLAICYALGMTIAPVQDFSQQMSLVTPILLCKPVERSEMFLAVICTALHCPAMQLPKLRSAVFKRSFGNCIAGPATADLDLCLKHVLLLFFLHNLRLTCLGRASVISLLCLARLLQQSDDNVLCNKAYDQRETHDMAIFWGNPSCIVHQMST